MPSNFAPMLSFRGLSRLRPRPPLLLVSRYQSNVARSRPGAPKDFRVVLDNDTLYVDQDLAEALGWDATKRDGVPLTLHGWGPSYFAIARTGSDSEMLARRTSESGSDLNVQEVLQYLKDR